jgi:hypothetical protein
MSQRECWVGPSFNWPLVRWLPRHRRRVQQELALGAFAYLCMFMEGKLNSGLLLILTWHA